MPPDAAFADSTALIRRRSLPPGGVLETVAMDDGWPVRTMRWQPAACGPGSILFLGGRGDFIEKYSEALWAWRERGAGVATFDWRGQGLSGRLGSDAMRGHSDSFGRWVDDLDKLVEWFVATMPGPHAVIGHSMGGHLLLWHLARASSPISRAALLAPLFGIRTIIPLGLLARLPVALGFGGSYAPMQRPYGDWQQRPERRATLTSDAERFADEHWWIAQNPALALGGVTWGWIDAATRSVADLLRPGRLESIHQPVLTLSGAWERLVDPVATQRAMRRVPNGSYLEFPSAAHELLRESPAIQHEVHARLHAFLFGAAA